MEKARRNRLNGSFIRSQQYEKVAKRTVNVGNLINDESYNEEILSSIIDDILGNQREQKHIDTTYEQQK